MLTRVVSLVVGQELEAVAVPLPQVAPQKMASPWIYLHLQHDLVQTGKWVMVEVAGPLAALILSMMQARHPHPWARHPELRMTTLSPKRLVS